MFIVCVFLCCVVFCTKFTFNLVCLCLFLFALIMLTAHPLCSLTRVLNLTALPYGWEESYTPDGEKYYLK